MDNQVVAGPPDADAAMSSTYACFSMQDPESASIVGVIHYTVLDETNQQANDNYTNFLVRHASAEAALRNLPLKEEIPRWFVTGVATYCERYWDPFNSKAGPLLAQWSADNLNREGGVMKLKNFFEPFSVTRQTVLQAGMVVAYLQDSTLDAGVKEQWEKVKALLATDHQKGLTKEFFKLETLLTKDAEDRFLDYADRILKGA